MPKVILLVGGQSHDPLHMGQLPQALLQCHFGTLPRIPEHMLQGSKRRGQQKKQVARKCSPATDLRPRMQVGLGRAHSLVVRQVATKLGFEAGGAGPEGGVTQPVSGGNRDVVTSRPERPLHPP